MWDCSETKQDKAEITVVHYIHKISHCPKIVAKRFDVDVVFSAPRKMSRVCSAVERKAMSCPGSVQPLFYLAHIGMWPAAWRWSTRYRYKIPFKCKLVYWSNRIVFEYLSS